MSHGDHGLRPVRDCVWELPRAGAMRVPGRVYADEKLLAHIREEKALDQVANVAHLPGIVRCSLAMPDIHWGYGFPIGGVAATDPEQGGVVSPGGVGYDINCGVRLATSRTLIDEVRPRVPELVRALFHDVPCGLGSHGAIGKLTKKELTEVMAQGAAWAVKRGLGDEPDLERTEERGRLPQADPAAVSERAVERGLDQVGTLGSGNHFLEIGFVDEIYDEKAAAAFDLSAGEMTLLVHSGSRGLGYQVCDDSLEIMQRAVGKYRIALPDRQLACAPVESPEGKRYLAAMACAANYAWANRQVIMALAFRTISRTLGAGPEKLGLRLLYDVCHNIAKLERHEVDGERRLLCVHRKGATRAFPAGHRDVATAHAAVGQPVLVPGDMGRESYVCVGTDTAMAETFGSTCHGAGRVLSRAAAKKASAGRRLEEELTRMGVFVVAEGRGTLAEEMPHAYKNVADVVGVMERAGIARRVARLKPVGVMKG
ncbi:MAG: RtcB family protein [Candidatus Eisenbacteria bacterium]|nr:RtcB family protein [Candidatus Eisenbacteria bacterium]